jgi:hypothetical protein
MRRLRNAHFRAVAWAVCRIATDLAIVAFGAGYTYQSVAHSRSNFEVGAGIALTLVGCGLTAVAVRSYLRRRINGPAP